MMCTPSLPVSMSTEHGADAFLFTLYPSTPQGGFHD
jgi:hypothetical protein